MRKYWVVLTLIPAACQASFELGLVVNAPAGGTPSIQRYDVTTGIYLGDFARGTYAAAIRSMWADSSTGSLYTMNASGIRKYNYSTGELLGIVNNFATDGRGIAVDDNMNALAVLGNTINRYGIDGNDTIASTLPTGTVGRWIVRLSNGRYMVGDSANSRILLSSTTNVSTSTWSAAATGVTIAANEQIGVAGSFSLFSSAFHHAIVTYDSVTGASNGVQFFNASLSYSGSQPTFTSIGVTGATGIARAHTGFWITGRTATANQGAWDRWEPDNHFHTFSPSQLTAPGAATVVLAPEPGSMIALGAGLLAVIARRRRQK